MAINQDSDRVKALGPREIFLLLTEKGLLDSSRFVTSSVRLRPASHRNHNFFVECDTGPSYFLKQGISDSTAATVRREAAFYESASISFPALTKYLPRFVCFLPESCILVLDLVVGGLPLNQVSKRRLTPRIFFRLGSTMALLHGKSD